MLLSAALRAKVVCLLLLQWEPKAIAEELHCHFTTVYRIQSNLFMYGSAWTPRHRPKGCPRKVHAAAEKGLIQYVTDQPCTQQKEMIWYLWEEWGLWPSQPTISRSLAKNRRSRKRAQRLGPQSPGLWLAWFAAMLGFTAEQLVTVDETLFNESKFWRNISYRIWFCPGLRQALYWSSYGYWEAQKNPRSVWKWGSSFYYKDKATISSNAIAGANDIMIMP